VHVDSAEEGTSYEAAMGMKCEPSFSLPCHIRAGGKSSPSPSPLPADSVFITAELARGCRTAGGAEILNKI